MRSPCCLRVCESPLITFESLNQSSCMNLGKYIMAPEPNSTAYFINPSPQSVSVCVSLLSLLGNGSVKCIPPFIARQRLGKHFPAARNTRSNRRIVGRLCLWVCLCRLSLLGNKWVKAFPLQRRIIGSVIFCAVRVVSNENLRRTAISSSQNFLFYLPSPSRL
jgi:hypothetical protein